MITIENFDKLYPKSLKGFGTRYNRLGHAVSYYSRALTILGKQVTVWWHAIPEMAHIATVECSCPETFDFITDRIWDARNENN